MPSRKVLSAVTGQTDSPFVMPRGTPSAVRFSTKPEDDKDARLQEDLKASVDGLLKGTPFQNGTILEITFTTDSLTQGVPHHLGAPAKGFIVIDIIGNAAIYRSDELGPTAVLMPRGKTIIRLTATAPCKAKVWVWS